jgi:hypothetical protein
VVAAFDRCGNVTEGSRWLEGDQRSVRPTISWNKDKVRQVKRLYCLDTCQKVRTIGKKVGSLVSYETILSKCMKIASILQISCAKNFDTAKVRRISQRTSTQRSYSSLQFFIEKQTMPFPLRYSKKWRS